jgi:hypothetical protein
LIGKKLKKNTIGNKTKFEKLIEIKQIEIKKGGKKTNEK